MRNLAVSQQQMDENLELFRQRKEREAAKKAAEIAQDQDELAFTNATELKYTMRGTAQNGMIDAVAQSQTLDKKVKLYYFPVEGRAGAIRLMLNHGKCDWEDVRVTFEEWPSLKPSMPNGCMPALQWEDGSTKGESFDIAEMVAKHCGYMPSDPHMANECIALSKEFAGMLDSFCKCVVSPGEDQAAEIKECVEKTVPEFIARIEGLLAKSGGKWLLGD